MLIALATDVHGNRPAFEAVIGASQAAGAEELWCLGDVVGYGAEPDACVALAKAHTSVCLAGNHDLGVTGEISIAEFSPAAKRAAEWTAEVIGPDTRSFLEGLRPFQGVRGMGLFHASPRDPVWEYVLDTLTAELCLDSVKQPVNLIGHTHVALSFSRFEGEPATGMPREAGEVADLSTGEWLLNPGGCGQPRDGDPRAAWLLLDTDAQTATWQRQEYDIAAAQQAIRDAGLPDSLAERLRIGQ